VPLSRTLFVSDLHLAEERPQTTARFERFLGDALPGAGALYILGDLFEYWAGDDTLELPFESRVGGLLREAASAVPTAFLHGNRDFVVGARFTEATGIRLIEDPAVIDLGSMRAVLLHGDTLCTGDAAYQAFRAQVRDPRWQAAALARPLAERLALARGMRQGSETAKGGKVEAIMDVDAQAVEAAFRASGCDLMIHGHTHRPARHVHRVDGRECIRWVLPDWYEGGGYLAAGPEGIEAVRLD
jgi:UDP-2,3-diacylglucosamine hydrolase